MLKYACLLLVLFCSNLVAQDHVDYIELGFSKPNISWAWQGKVNIERPAADELGIRFYDEFSSSLLIPSKINPQWRDENKLRSFVFKSQGQSVYGVYANSWLLRDALGKAKTQSANHAVGLQAEYMVQKNLKINPYAGYQKSQNRSRIEWGWDFGLAGIWQGISLGDYRTELELQSEYDFFHSRQNATNVFDIRLATEFSASSRDTLVLTYKNDRQQFFSTTGDQLIDRSEESRILQNVLDYAVSRKSYLRFTTLLSNGRIQNNTPGDINKRDTFTFRNRFSYNLIRGSFRMELGLDTYLESEDNIGLKRDIKARQTSLFSLMTYSPGKNDIFDLQLSYLKFQFDTPDANNDDRDELRFIGSLGHQHKFSKFLKSKTEFYAFLYHRVYLKKEQSANNNWNRRFRLDATVTYNSGKIQNIFSSQVLAIYTVFDFDDLFNETRSFVFRRYMVADSIIFPLFEDFYGGLYGRLELEDRGNFIERTFSQKLIESAQVLYFDMQIRKQLLCRFSWELGYSVYQRIGWRHVSVKVRAREINKNTQYIRIVYPLSEVLRVAGQISFTAENDKGREKLSYTTGNMNIYYMF